MPRFAANISLLFHELPFLDRFAAAADAGFTAVECQFPYDHPAERVAARLRANALSLVLFNMPPGDWAAGDRGLAALPSRAAACRDSLARAVDYAGITETRRLHLLAGIANPADPAAQAAYRRALEYAAPRLHQANQVLLIEPINPRDIPGYFLSDFPTAERLIAASGLPNLKLQFDIYHRQILHGDVSRALERLLPQIGHIQVAGVPHRAEPTTGELDDAHLFALLDRLGYQGHIGAEYIPAHGTQPGLAWFAPYRAPPGHGPSAQPPVATLSPPPPGKPA